MKIGRKRGQLVRANGGPAQSHVQVRRIDYETSETYPDWNSAFGLRSNRVGAKQSAEPARRCLLVEPFRTARLSAQAYDQALDQAQRCSSYPEYQCLPAAEPTEQKISAKHSAKVSSKVANNTPAAVGSEAAPDTNASPSNSK